MVKIIFKNISRKHQDFDLKRLRFSKAEAKNIYARDIFDHAVDNWPKPANTDEFIDLVAGESGFNNGCRLDQRLAHMFQRLV